MKPIEVSFVLWCVLILLAWLHCGTVAEYAAVGDRQRIRDCPYVPT